MLTLEEEAKRFIEAKKVQFIAGLDEGVEDIFEYLLDNLLHSDEREYAIKALQEAVLWSRECANKYGIK